MARRTRGPRVVWLPPNAAAIVGETTGLIRFSVAALGGVGNVSTSEIQVVLPEVDHTTTTNSISDLTNSGYRLRRIVGKIFVHAAFVPGEQGLAEASNLVVTAGFIVRRVGENGSSLAEIADPTGKEISPSEIQNWSDPWIWRRSWFLSNPEMELVATLKDQVTNNYGHGPAAVDGPHIDQKTARIIGPEEGLFLSVSATIISVGSDPENAVPVEITGDIRCLGSIRTSTGNRRNASR